MKTILSIITLAFAGSAAAVNTIGYNEYIYAIPVYSNLIHGIVMGENGDYGAVRYEDIAWLRNAVTERLQAMVNGMDTPYEDATNALAQANIQPPTIRRPEEIFYSADCEIPIRDLIFANPSNQYSKTTRLIDTNYVSIAVRPVASIIGGAVTNIITRNITMPNGNSVVDAYTNTYSVSSNIWHQPKGGGTSAWDFIPTNRSPEIADFCFTDYQREGISFDNGESTNRIPTRFINKFSITNMYAFLKNASNISRVQEFIINSSTWERRLSEYEHETGDFSGPYFEGVDNYDVIKETNTISVVSNQLPKIAISNNRWDSGGQLNYAAKGENGGWESYTSGQDDYFSLSSDETSSGQYVIRVQTPISTNAFAAIGSKSPIVKAVCFAQATVEYYYGVAGAWSATNDSGFEGCATNMSQNFSVMIPLGEAKTIYIPNNADKTNQTEYVCLELTCSDLQEKMKKAITSFLTESEVPEYKKVPSYLIEVKKGDMIPTLNATDGNPSKESGYAHNVSINMSCEISQILGAFYYDWATKLPTWNKETK